MSLSEFVRFDRPRSSTLTIDSDAASDAMAVELGQAALNATLVNSLELSAACLERTLVGVVGVTLGEGLGSVLTLVAGVGGHKGGEGENEGGAEVHIHNGPGSDLLVRTVLFNWSCRASSS